MTGVQIIGKDAVLSRFNKFDTDTWALYQGKQFIVGGIGEDQLSDWLNDLSTAGSTATYVLRMYDAELPPTAATGNADYVASINFKLVDSYEGQGIHGHSVKLMQRLDAIEKKLDAEEQGEEEPGGINDVIMGWLTEPEKLGMVVGAFRQLVGMGGALPPAPMQAIAGFNVAKDNAPPGVDKEQQLQILAKALDILEKADPKIVEHLDKLATLSQTDPLIFAGVITKVNAL